MSEWFMLTLVGEDRPGIVAKVTGALYEAGANLGEAAMMRLGGNFSIMMMASHEGPGERLEAAIAPVAEELNLRTHVDRIEGKLHSHVEPDVRITLFGADRAGIVAKATGALAEAGLNISHLESDVGGTDDKPIYIMSVEGVAAAGIDALRDALAKVSEEGMETHIEPIDTLIG